MNKIQILWTDDEIDLLKPHIIFLEHKGYQVDTATNGKDALDSVKKKNYDLIFLDENMPGLSGLETLEQIKDIDPAVPVVMITKSEEENIMDQAIGARINDYLIKPVNPKQILLSIKKNIDHERLISEKTSMDYQVEFRNLGMRLNEQLNYQEWVDIYKELTGWELKIEASEDSTMDEILKMQKQEASNSFGKFISRNYESWLKTDKDDKPLMSHQLLKKQVFPLLKENKKVVFMLIDNLRYDQWKVIQPLISRFYHVKSDTMYCTILPTATQYARNAIFSGLMPSEIHKKYPDLWKNDHEEGGKNLHEEEMLQSLIQRFFGKEKTSHYEKAFDISYCTKIKEKLHSILHHDLNAIVVNFVDMMSHARTDMKMIRELTGNESAYRSLTKSWFQYSPLFDLIQELAEHDIELILTSDHGSIMVQNPVKVIGDRNTTTNLRYKQGKNLDYNPKEVFEIKDPRKAFLPKSNISSTYIFATGHDYFVYPNNYKHYMNMYKGTLQHGGISMEEMLVPLIHLSPKPGL
ncbi:MAG: PglZ domain-containing protein [Bacteroidales bacterium]